MNAEVPRAISMAFWKYLNPLHPFTSTAKNIASSVRGISASLKAAKAELSRRQEEATVMAKSGLTPKEKFNAVVTEKKWTESELVAQAGASRRARRFFIAAIYIGVPIQILVSLFTAWWIGIIILVTTVAFATFFSLMAAKHAWMEWQISIRSLEPFKVFASRSDMFKRVLLP